MEQIKREVEVASPQQLPRKSVAVVDILSVKTVQDHMINLRSSAKLPTGAVEEEEGMEAESRPGRKQSSGRRPESPAKKSGQYSKNMSTSSGQFLVDIDEIIAAGNGTSFGDIPEFSNLSRSARASTTNYDIKVSVAGLTSPLDEKSTADTLTLNIDMHEAGEKITESPSSVKENSDLGQWREKRTEPCYPIRLKFVDVMYKVRFKGRNATEKQILQGVTGSVHPGEVLALLGPSGGGKTTLLNLLSGRVGGNASSGTITYNDQPYTKSLKQRIGYVLQDDVVFPHLTVKETLTYAARLRLPSTLTKPQKEERAMEVISELGLERCRDAVIGGTFLRGISGGERKRVCIGSEILLNPSLIFLDEPTSGLDSTTALRIVQVLQKIAQGGKTIVTTIHQPSSRLFSKFDKLILLGKGTSLYSGKASEAMLYFSSIGCYPLIAMNPAEFLIDLANGNFTDKSIPSGFETRKGEDSAENVHEYLVEAYRTKGAVTEKKKLVKVVQVEEDQVTAAGEANPREWGARWWEQFSILFWRGLKERRHDYLSWLRVTQVLATSVILGLLWWNSDSSTDHPQHLQDQAGLLFFISVFWGFFPVFTSIFTFPQEKAMLSKERSVDMYRLSAYFVARNTSDLPLDLILPIVFMLIVYFMAGLKQSIDAFFLSILAVLLSIVAAQGLGLAIGAAIMDIKKATTLASVTVMTFMLAGGFFVQRVPPFISWLRHLSFNYHTFRLLLKIQYGCSSSADPLSKSCSSPFIKRLGLGNDGTDVSSMVAMIIGYRLLAYYFLRKMELRTTA